MDTTVLGRVIKTERKVQGLTQEALAAASGVGIRFVRELEEGKPSCHLGKTLSVLKALGLEIFIKGTES
ncbi:MAG: type II toxin-antitoxin system Y4mF family antitoxin [Vampirovibrionales bacterium]